MRHASFRLWLTRAVLATSVAACVSLPAAPAYALQIDGYSAANNNRFLSDGVTPNPSFFANAYDLTGIATNGPGILISPHYIVSQWHASTQGNPTFLNKAGQTITTSVMESARMMTNGVGSDLRISRLYDNQGITPADGVSYYPIVVKKTASGALDTSWYLFGGKPSGGLPFGGQQLLVFGRANQTGQTAGVLAGTNTIVTIGQVGFGDPTNPSPTEIARFDYDATKPYQNQSALAGGDSGSPVGMIVDGQLTALGANMGASNWTATGWSSYSSFLPYYVDQINAYMAQGDTGEQVTVIPEPMSLGLLVLGGLGLLGRPKMNYQGGGSNHRPVFGRKTRKGPWEC